MAGNSFGELFKLTSFGESHGRGIGGVIEGIPPNLEIDVDFIQSELNRRKPGQSKISTPRSENDEFEILSGVFDGKATGTPLAFVIWNKNQRSGDYGNLKDIYRPSHADYTYQKKYGIRDYRGGGRSSARETIARVVAGAFAKLSLRKFGIEIQAYTSQIGEVELNTPYNNLDLNSTENNIVRCPDSKVAKTMIAAIDKARIAKDSLGGVVSCVIKKCPVGLGEPVFDKFHAQLGKAMLSINAVKGFEVGLGFDAAKLKGSENNDSFTAENGEISTLTNNSGGLLGGISNGEDIYMKVAFKPVASIAQEQSTVDINNNNVKTSIQGRHDPCVVPRAVPIVEAMAAMVVLDMMYINRIYQF